MPAIKYPVKYLAEMFRQISRTDPFLAIPDDVFSRENNIYAFSIATQITASDNYWIEWGGTFDNYDSGYGIQVFFDGFLTEVFLPETLEAVERSFYIDKTNDIVYIHIEKSPFQFRPSRVALYTNINSVFASAPKDQFNLSDNRFGDIRADIRMKIPSMSNQLSNIISGSKFNSEFNIDIDNSDGRYDDYDILSFYNTPIQVLKDSEGKSDIEDFNLIQRGMVSNLQLSFDSLTITATDIFYTFNKEFCREFLYLKYPMADIEGFLMPVAWGPVKRAPVFEVNRDTAEEPEWVEYFIIDPDYLTDVTAVYDSEGNELDFTYDSSMQTVTITKTGEELIEAESADIYGKTDNKLSDIIIEALEFEGLSYVVGVWDITEVETYANICPEISLYFESGSTNDLISKAMQNDSVFLIQKNDGLITLRRFGEYYDNHTIRNTAITKKPDKNFADANSMFCSTVKILSEKEYSIDNYDNSLIYDIYEDTIFNEYKKSFLAIFETGLLTESDRADFADRIIWRFGQVRETLGFGVGVDTFQINLLDRVYIDITINGRQFSEYKEFIVKGIDPGQDEIIVESWNKLDGLSLDGEAGSLDGEEWETSFESSFLEVTDEDN